MCAGCPDLQPASAWNRSHVWPVKHVAPEEECDCFFCYDAPFRKRCVAAGKPNHYYDPEAPAWTINIADTTPGIELP